MILRWLLLGFLSWCFLAGVWQHDWILIVATVALAGVFVLIGAEVRDGV